MARWGEDAQARLERAASGDEAKRLCIRDLRPGDMGILFVRVASIAPEHTFMRKNGTEGRLCRATLRDDTGEVDMVLWGAEIQATQGDGPLRPGNRLTLRGALVKAGFRGGIELGWTGAEAEVLDDASTPLRGTLLSLSDTEPVPSPDGIQFKATATLETGTGPATVICWGDAVKQLQGRIGEDVAIQGVPNPLLDGHFVAGTPPRQ